MYKPAFKFGMAFCILAILCLPVRLQTPTETPKPLNTFQPEQEKLCTVQPISENRTYNFRELPRADKDAGAYGRTPWYRKLFPFLKTSRDKYDVDDIRTLQSEYGRPVPTGASNRTRKINSEIEQKLVAEQKEAEQNWQKWLAENTNAAETEKKQVEIAIRFKGLAAANLPTFDWRENGLDVGKAEFQGYNCNTCWAFATVDAMQISRRLYALRSNKSDFDDDEYLPSARQMISCMVSENDYCKVNWHGEAFSLMVDKGLPLGGTDKYVPNKSGWICDPDKYVKALTWDFVSASPQKVSTREEIKKAVITYGAVVSMMIFDRCLWLYGDGIFNEEQKRDGSHILLIIGWDDAKGAWLVKNSYGKDWGEKGFGWIKYETNNIGQFSAFIVADPQEEEKLSKELKQAEK